MKPQKREFGEFGEVGLCMSKGKVLLKTIQFFPLQREAWTAFLCLHQRTAAQVRLCLGLAQPYFLPKKEIMLCFEKYCFGVNSWLFKDHLKTTFHSVELWVYFKALKGPFTYIQLLWIH